MDWHLNWKMGHLDKLHTLEFIRGKYKKEILLKIQKLDKGLEFKEERGEEKTKVNWWILGGSLIFVIFTLSIGSFKVPLAQEIVFIGSVIIILFLMFKLIKELPEELRLTIVGTAVIIFIFRAMPGPGPGLTWFEDLALKELKI